MKAAFSGLILSTAMALSSVGELGLGAQILQLVTANLEKKATLDATFRRRLQGACADWCDSECRDNDCCGGLEACIGCPIPGCAADPVASPTSTTLPMPTPAPSMIPTGLPTGITDGPTPRFNMTCPAGKFNTDITCAIWEEWCKHP